VIDDITRLGSKSDLLAEGLDELAFVLDSLSDLPTGSIVVNLIHRPRPGLLHRHRVRGEIRDWPHYGSVCSGDRYENLAASFIRRSLPDVGLSIGLTRIFAKLVAEGLLPTGPRCPIDVLVVIPNDQRRPHAVATAAQTTHPRTQHRPNTTRPTSWPNRSATPSAKAPPSCGSRRSRTISPTRSRT
jgi:histidyl-tRNA synthetase